MKVIYLGDIMGRPGRHIVAQVLPGLRAELQADIVIAQAENVSHGKSMTEGHMRELQAAGVDAFSGGNHTTERPGLKKLLADPTEPVIAPYNQAGVEPAWGSKIIDSPKGKIQIISILTTIFLQTAAEMPIRNPLAAIDELLAHPLTEGVMARVVNIHGDFSSEKRVFGYYLDGRVAAVIGDHWHVPTADAMVLPHGTAHITDVGMCGTLHSSLGVSKEIIIARWRDGAKLRNDIAEAGPYQLNGVLIDINPATGLANSIVAINKIID